MSECELQFLADEAHSSRLQAGRLNVTECFYSAVCQGGCCFHIHTFTLWKKKESLALTPDIYVLLCISQVTVTSSANSCWIFKLRTFCCVIRHEYIFQLKVIVKNKMWLDLVGKTNVLTLMELWMNIWCTLFKWAGLKSRELTLGWLMYTSIGKVFRSFT